MKAVVDGKGRPGLQIGCVDIYADSRGGGSGQPVAVAPVYEHDQAEVWMWYESAGRPGQKTGPTKREDRQGREAKDGDMVVIDSGASWTAALRKAAAGGRRRAVSWDRAPVIPASKRQGRRQAGRRNVEVKGTFTEDLPGRDL